MSHSQTDNQVLQRLTREDFAALEPFLQRVELKLKQHMITPGQPITHVWFPEAGMFSMIAQTHGSEPIEVGLVGFEGMSDHVAATGDTSVLKTIVQLAGSALAVETGRYVEWLHDRSSVLHLVLRYHQTLLVQLSLTALSHGSFTTNERLARWLAMSFDRSRGGDLPLVHEFLAMMLGIRRAGVTDALHVLEGNGAIRATRGRIALRDRPTLDDMAGGSYGVPESEYLRVMGPVP